MWVPVATARRTVRSGRSPYTSRPWLVACQSSASRSMTASVGSRATIAPLRAPTDVPRTRSGWMSRSNSARSMPTSAAPSTPPPPSTNAVVTRSGPFDGEVGALLAHAAGHGVLDPEDHQRDQARDQREQGERDAPPGPARQQERDDGVDH